MDEMVEEVLKGYQVLQDQEVWTEIIIPQRNFTQIQQKQKQK